MTIERLERAWEMLIDVTEGQLIPFGNGQYEEITEVYGEQIRDVKNLITAEIERQQKHKKDPWVCPECGTGLYSDYLFGSEE